MVADRLVDMPLVPPWQLADRLEELGILRIVLLDISDYRVPTRRLINSQSLVIKRGPCLPCHRPGIELKKQQPREEYYTAWSQLPGLLQVRQTQPALYLRINLSDCHHTTVGKGNMLLVNMKIGKDQRRGRQRQVDCEE